MSWLVSLTLALLVGMPSGQSREAVAVRLPAVVTLAVPAYPPVARAAGVQGTVILRVRTDGRRVSDVRPVQGVPMLLVAAEENVRTWQFRPHLAVEFTVTFEFQLSGDFRMIDEAEELAESPTILLKLPERLGIATTRAGVPKVDPKESPSRK
jgi:hypothetical protein